MDVPRRVTSVKDLVDLNFIKQVILAEDIRAHIKYVIFFEHAGTTDHQLAPYPRANPGTRTRT